MTPGEMADRLEAMSISFADLDAAAAMLRELAAENERLREDRDLWEQRCRAYEEGQHPKW